MPPLHPAHVLLTKRACSSSVPVSIASPLRGQGAKGPLRGAGQISAPVKGESMLDLIRQRAQSWGVKIAFGIIILVFVFWGVGSYNQPSPGVAATVNGKPILMQEFSELAHRQTEQVRAMDPNMSEEAMKSLNIRGQVLQMIVTRAMLEQEAARLNITVTPLELLRVISAIPAFKDEKGAFARARYEKILEQQGQSVVKFEQDMARDLLMEKMRGYVVMAASVSPEEARRRFSFQMERRTISYVLFDLNDYRAGVSIGDDAVKTYYDANQSLFAEPAKTALRFVEVTPKTLAPSMTVSDAEVNEAYARGPQRYHLSQIALTLAADADAAKDAEVKAKIEGIAKEIADGADFATVAKEKSEDPSAAAGGDAGWVPKNRLDPVVVAALQNLKKGQLTQPLKVPAGYVLLRLEESDPDWSLPEAEIKAALRQSIGEEKAALAFRDIQGQAEDMLVLNKPLDEIAKELHVAVQTTQLAPRDSLAQALSLKKAFAPSRFDGAAGALVGSILETEDGFAVAEISGQQAAGVKSLDAVRADIVEVLTKQEAEKKAEEAARKAAPEFAKGVPDAFKDKLLTSAAFGRQGEIPGLGYSRALADAVFGSPLGVWLAQPYATSKGAVLVMPVESIAMTDAEWDGLRDRVVPGLLQAKQNELFSAYLRDLGERSKVDVPNPEIMRD